jgi:phosphoribosylanthranilate isomerase
MGTWIKICGITRLEDAIEAAAAGADALGFVMTPSPRRIAPDAVRAIVRGLPPHVMRFGVFVGERPSDIVDAVAAADVDRIQLHADADPVLHDRFGARIVRAFRARDEGVLDAIRASGDTTFLLDTWSPEIPGGSGRTFDWRLARRASELGRLILAGGLRAENVSDAIRQVRPFGVDVSSGVEDEPGRKSATAIRAFVHAVREADRDAAESSGVQDAVHP